MCNNCDSNTKTVVHRLRAPRWHTVETMTSTTSANAPARACSSRNPQKRTLRKRPTGNLTSLHAIRFHCLRAAQNTSRWATAQLLLATANRPHKQRTPCNRQRQASAPAEISVSNTANPATTISSCGPRSASAHCCRAGSERSAFARRLEPMALAPTRCRRRLRPLLGKQ